MCWHGPPAPRSPEPPAISATGNHRRLPLLRIPPSTARRSIGRGCPPAVSNSAGLRERALQAENAEALSPSCVRLRIGLGACRRCPHVQALAPLRPGSSRQGRGQHAPSHRLRSSHRSPDEDWVSSMSRSRDCTLGGGVALAPSPLSPCPTARAGRRIPVHLATADRRARTATPSSPTVIHRGRSSADFPHKAVGRHATPRALATRFLPSPWRAAAVASSTSTPGRYERGTRRRTTPRLGTTSST